MVVTWWIVAMLNGVLHSEYSTLTKETKRHPKHVSSEAKGSNWLLF